MRLRPISTAARSALIARPAMRVRIAKPHPSRSQAYARLLAITPPPHRGQRAIGALATCGAVGGAAPRIASTVSATNRAMSAMNASRVSSPRATRASRASQDPVSSGDASAATGSASISPMPVAVGRRLWRSRAM